MPPRLVSASTNRANPSLSRRERRSSRERSASGARAGSRSSNTPGSATSTLAPWTTRTRFHSFRRPSVNTRDAAPVCIGAARAPDEDAVGSGRDRHRRIQGPREEREDRAGRLRRGGLDVCVAKGLRHRDRLVPQVEGEERRARRWREDRVRPPPILRLCYFLADRAPPGGRNPPSVPIGKDWVFLSYLTRCS